MARDATCQSAQGLATGSGAAHNGQSRGTCQELPDPSRFIRCNSPRQEIPHSWDTPLLINQDLKPEFTNEFLELSVKQRATNVERRGRSIHNPPWKVH